MGILEKEKIGKSFEGKNFVVTNEDGRDIGGFDTPEEAKAWMASPGGQKAMKEVGGTFHIVENVD